jgi:hypothetical protein
MTTPAISASIRDSLFGDVPLAQWGKEASGGVWGHFAEAREHLAANEKMLAIAALRQVLDTPALESRHYLQAWHFLRQLGQTPPAPEAKRVLGVVIEVPMNGGLDLLAAYSDHSSRYFNYSGSAVVVDAPHAELVALIDRLLSLAAVIVAKIGPWDKDRPAPPPNGSIRLNFLTPSGIHFGQGPFQDFAHDPMAGPVINAATTLMQFLIKLGESARANGRPAIK